MAADSKGNIGYWHPGLVQQRPAKWDQRLPLPGTGEAEWPGLVPRSKLPSIINPKQGYLVNWNNIPSQGWTTGDGEATERVTGALHRVGWLDRQVRTLKRNPTFAGAEQAVRRAGTFAQQRPLAAGILRRAARGVRPAASRPTATASTSDRAPAVQPDRDAGEFPATLSLTPWTVDDTLSVGIFLARTVPSGDGAELSNLQALQDPAARRSSTSCCRSP